MQLECFLPFHVSEVHHWLSLLKDESELDLKFMDSSRVPLSQPRLQAGVVVAIALMLKAGKIKGGLKMSHSWLQACSLPLLHWKWTYNACTRLSSLDSSLPFFFACVCVHLKVWIYQPTHKASQSRVLCPAVADKPDAVLHHQPQWLGHDPVMGELCWIFWREEDPSWLAYSVPGK